MTRNILTRLIRDESGATAIEYGLIVALVACVAMAGFSLLGTDLKNLFNQIAGKLVIPS